MSISNVDQLYTENGRQKLETVKWVQTTPVDPRGQTIPNHTGKWRWVGSMSPTREIPSLPYDTDTQVVYNATSGDYESAVVRGSPIMEDPPETPNPAYWGSPYWDYYSLPLRAGVSLI